MLVCSHSTQETRDPLFSLPALTNRITFIPRVYQIDKTRPELSLARAFGAQLPRALRAAASTNQTGCVMFSH